MRQFLCPTMIGRGAELAEICGALESARQGAGGSSIFVVGEAGVGKSRLAREAIAEARTVRTRLTALGDAADILTAAATLGRRFDWRLLAAISGRHEDEVLAGLRRAVDCQLLSADPYSSFAFRHALTRVAVLAGLLPPERSERANRALQALEDGHPGLPGALCELGASLAEASGSAVRAAELLLEAGRRARERGAVATAEALRPRREPHADHRQGAGLVPRLPRPGQHPARGDHVRLTQKKRPTGEG